MRTFRLFPDEQRWWSFADHEVLLELVEEVRPRDVLEFGPGSSTLALIEGGAVNIVSCEDDPDYLRHFASLEDYGVLMLSYVQADPPIVPGLDEARVFEFGFVDGPNGSGNRGPVIAYAAARCQVLACHDAHLQPVIDALRALPHRRLEFRTFRRTPHGDLNAIGIAWPC